MKKKQIYLFLGLFLLPLILLLFGSTYAYYIAKPIGNDNISNTEFNTDLLKLSYDGTSKISGSIKNPGDSVSTVFSVKNNNADDYSSYNIYFSNVINNYNYTNYLVYTITCTSYDSNSNISGSCNGVGETIAPIKSKKVLISSSIAAGYTHKYLLVITYKESNFDQTTDIGKTFLTDITINKQSGYLSYEALGNDGGSSSIISRGNPNYDNITSTDEGMYETEDQDGKAYYYRGSVNDNYVSFASLTWRIVRINGDGTIRLILDDYAKDSSSSYITTGYNTSANCAGGTTDSVSKAVECAKYGSGNYASTSIKNIIDTWYTNNISGTDNNYVVTGNYCNDYSYYPVVNNYNYFSAKARLLDNKTPSLFCSSYSGYTGGGVAVVNAKAGLMTADDLVFAGGKWNTTNTNVYYYKDNNIWWTMTPMVWANDNHTFVMFNYSNLLNVTYASSLKYIKPVINLDKTTIVTGSGTVSDKYVVTSLKSMSDDVPSNIDEPLNTNTLKSKIFASEDGISKINARNDFTINSISSNLGLYASSDSDGQTYFYRGSNVADNYVSFAGKIWRIIRINGDGTIRIMLNVAATNTSGTTYSVAYNSATLCKTNAITTPALAEECAKYGYGTYSATSIKNTVDTWYNDNITGTNLNYVTSSKYCNDYKLVSQSGLYYYTKSYELTKLNYATYQCSNLLTLNVGLLSSLEALNYTSIKPQTITISGTTVLMDFSNFYFSSTTYNTPHLFNTAFSSSYFDNNYGTIQQLYNFRPVINLKANVTVTGIGTIGSPYVISGLAN